MTNQGPDVDVVILAWNDGDLVDRAVESALTSQRSVQVVVIDNGSHPPVSPYADQRVTVVRNDTNRGVAPARNQGARVGTAPFICFLDSDAMLGLGALDQLVDALERHPSAALVGPVFAGQAAEASGGGAPTLWRKAARLMGISGVYRRGAELEKGLIEVDFVIGACQVFRRSSFAAVDGLDESYFYGPEDVDLCLRLRDAGGQVLQVVGPHVEHPPRRRNRRVLTRRGVQHARAVLRHLRRRRRM